MGYDSRSVSFTAMVSRHNSERDREHDALWEDFCRRAREIADEEQYRAIILNEGP
jgi:hypothetical protein